MFDRYIAVDWSASNEPKSAKDSIWSCLGVDRTSELRTDNHRTRRAAERWLLGQLIAAVRAGERVLVGLDFPYGYPAGFAAALGVEGEPWKGVWVYLDRHVRDDERNVSNRFEVAAKVNALLGRDAPFWGRPKHLLLPSLPFRKEVVYRGGHEAGGLSEWRQVEEQLHRLKAWPQSVWKLAGAGAVGSQSLVGIPVVRRLRDHDVLRDISRVWPFELLVPKLQVGVPAVIHAEIWPSIVSFAEEAGSCPDEQQVRAVVRLWRDLDQADRLGELFAAAPDNSAVRREEGWVLGVPSPGTRYVSARPDGRASSIQGPSRAAPAPTGALEEVQATEPEIVASVTVDRERRQMVRVMRRHVSGYDDVPSDVLVERIDTLEAMLGDPEHASLRSAAQRQLRACRRALEPDFAHTKVHHATNCWYVNRYEEGRFPGGAKRRFVLVPVEEVPDNVSGCQYCESGRPAAVKLRRPKSSRSSEGAPSAATKITEPPPGSVQLGSVVQVVDLAAGEMHRWDIVAPNESDPRNGKISSASPIGKALVGHLPGEVIEVKAPRATRSLRIIDASAGHT